MTLFSKNIRLQGNVKVTLRPFTTLSLFMTRVKSMASTIRVGKRHLPFRPVTAQHPRTPRAFWQHRGKPNVRPGQAPRTGRDGTGRSGAARQPRAPLEPSPRRAAPRPTGRRLQEERPEGRLRRPCHPTTGAGEQPPESSRRPATPPAAWAGGSARLGRLTLHLTSAPPLCPLARRGEVTPYRPAAAAIGWGGSPRDDVMPTRAPGGRRGTRHSGGGVPRGPGSSEAAATGQALPELLPQSASPGQARRREYD